MPVDLPIIKRFQPSMEIVGEKKIFSQLKKKGIALMTWHEQLPFLKEKNCSATSWG